jgi:Sortase domain
MPNRAGPTVLKVLGILLLVLAATILGNHLLGQGRAGRTLSSAPLPPGLGPVLSSTSVPSASAPVSPAPLSLAPKNSRVAVPAVAAGVVADRPGVPLRVVVAGHQVQAAVSADRLNADGSLFVPADPAAVSWASQDVGPGSSHGTAILVGHVNYRGVQGAFFDLADYQVGQEITVVLADRRTLKYVVAAPPIEVNKDQVAARRQELFDQTHSYGLAGKPRSGRLLLLSCGGAFDNRTGHYESNIFVYAMPV